MPLKKSTGNMYSWVTHTWNPVKGKCPYECSYCYVSRFCKRFGREQREPYLDERELRADLGSGNTIFVCDSIDLFTQDISTDWLNKVVVHTLKAPDNTYLWHTKNPERAALWLPQARRNILCVTIESDVHRPEISNAPPPESRAEAMRLFQGRKMVTIEPMMKFDPFHFADMINGIHAEQINIGADSGKNNLPEPTRGELEFLITRLALHAKIHLKSNLRRILPAGRYFENG